jgi:acid phosphatase
MRKLLIAIAAIFLLPSFSWAGSPDEPANAAATVYSPAERVANLGQAKQLVRRYYACDCDCGCYTKELEEQSARAIAFLRNRAAEHRPDDKLAVVLDIDDTAVANYPYYVTTDFGHVPTTFDAWVLSAKAPAIVPTLDIFKAARELGMAVFFISGRREQQRAATEENLIAAGYKEWSGMILRGPEDTGTKAIDFKAAGRKKIIQQGYRVVLNVGDQLSDLAGDPQAEFSVKLPNPMYFIP